MITVMHEIRFGDLVHLDRRQQARVGVHHQRNRRPLLAALDILRQKRPAKIVVMADAAGDGVYRNGTAFPARRLPRTRLFIQIGMRKHRKRLLAQKRDDCCQIRLVPRSPKILQRKALVKKWHYASSRSTRCVERRETPLCGNGRGASEMARSTQSVEREMKNENLTGFKKPVRFFCG